MEDGAAVSPMVSTIGVASLLKGRLEGGPTGPLLNLYSNVRVELPATGRFLSACPLAAGIAPRSARARRTGASCDAPDAKDTGPRMPASPAACCPP
ncbi:hypothetical protein Psi01_77800 [Planobispora siamensis]|uniref:Uncharacterized protein n=1 Tax=Planobispora siamensis TaxID=936338 RepID=A0A8J3SR14_9ACTN|nr:hypothetical protein Psi01_77800 [Planobispora siamensis]